MHSIELCTNFSTTMVYGSLILIKFDFNFIYHNPVNLFVLTISYFS